MIGVKKLPPIFPKLEIVIDPPKNSFLSILSSLQSVLTFFNSFPNAVISFLVEYLLLFLHGNIFYRLLFHFLNLKKR